jgi:hypothetical protein
MTIAIMSRQARGLIVIDSTKHVGGYVAVLPIGMAQVSSCNITAEVGDWLHKCEEFGYFLFGGSDIIILFDKDCDVNICMKPNTHYKQGEAVAYAGVPCPDGRPSCPPSNKDPKGQIWPDPKSFSPIGSQTSTIRL